ncbi:MAG: DMT family transporter [Gemmatimonadetes bacterium]|nr:DMT family transporter [Gemmatimonadota bacterium]
MTRAAGSGGALALVAGASLISFSPVFVQLAHVGPATAAFYRTLFGGAVLAVLFVLRGRGGTWDSRVAAWLAVGGLLFSLDLIVWHQSIHYIGPGLATILGNCQVFVFAGYGFLVLGERVTHRFVLAVPLAFTGLVLIFGLDWSQLGPQYRIGVAFGFVTALAYGAYLIVLRRVQRRPNAPHPVTAMTAVSLSAAAVLGVAVPFVGESFVIPDAQSWAALIALGLVSQVLGWVLIVRGLPHVPASRAGLLLLLQPALAFTWDVVLFSRTTSAVEYLGVTLVLGGIYYGGKR